MPWLMIKFIKGILRGYANINTPFPMVVVKAFLKNVAAMKYVTIPPTIDPPIAEPALIIAICPSGVIKSS
jgi:hypothetical protein